VTWLDILEIHVLSLVKYLHLMDLDDINECLPGPWIFKILATMVSYLISLLFCVVSCIKTDNMVSLKQRMRNTLKTLKSDVLTWVWEMWRVQSSECASHSSSLTTQVSFHKVSLALLVALIFLAKYRTARLENSAIILWIISVGCNTIFRSELNILCFYIAIELQL
jgi:hypothetical protein